VTELYINQQTRPDINRREMHTISKGLYSPPKLMKLIRPSNCKNRKLVEDKKETYQKFTYYILNNRSRKMMNNCCDETH